MKQEILDLELDKLKACIHCGMCLPACPTYRVTGSEAESPRGRLYLMKKMIDGELEKPQQLSSHLDQCLACHACETVCPSGVQYGSLLLNTREQLSKKQPWLLRQFKRFNYQFILPNHGILKLIAGTFRFYQKSGLKQLLHSLGLLNLFPSLQHLESLTPTLNEPYKEIKAGQSYGNPDGIKVVLFTGCVMDVLYNPVHWATINVLVSNNCYVTIPKQTCCGALAHHGGEVDITKALARENIDHILTDNPDYIVINSGGCGSTLKDYGHLLDTPEAKHFSEKTVDIMELLATLNADKKLTMPAYPVKTTVAYHASCHLHHVQGVKTEPLEILNQIMDLKLVPLPDADMCCGSAGVYNVEHPELANDILAMKMKNIETVFKEEKIDTLVTGNPGCLLQLEKGCKDAGIHLTLKHPVELLAQAYRHDVKKLQQARKEKTSR